MAVRIAPSPRQQFEDANGVPYVGGKLFTYAAGSSTKQSTFTDSTGNTANANPIVLDAAGRTPFGLWLTAGLNYKFVLALSTDTDPPTSPVFTEDNISGVNDSATTTSQWIAAGATPTYINGTTFSLVGDKTADFHVGRRLKLTVTAGTVYAKITASAYTTLTTVTVSGGTLDSGLSAVELSILTATNNALPDPATVGIQPLDDQLTTLAAITATQATDLAATSTFMGTVLNDPSQGVALTTLGAPLNAVTTLSATYIVVLADRGKLFDCTGTWTLNIDPVASVGAGFSFAVRNSGTGTITIDPASTQLIDGLAVITIAPGESFFVSCDGTGFKTTGRSGKILQVVHTPFSAVATGTTIIPLDDTIPQITEGDQYMSQAITPLSSTSTLMVDVIYLANSTVASWMTGAVFRDATAGSVGAATAYRGTATAGVTTTFSVKVTSASIALTTFYVRIGADVAGTTTFNGLSGGRLFGGVAASSIRITEIAA